MRSLRHFLPLPFALAAFCVGSEARADTIPLAFTNAMSKNIVQLGFGQNGGWSLTASYARRFNRILGKFPIQLEAAYTQPLMLIYILDGAKLSGAASSMVYRKKWGVSYGVGPDVVFGKDAVGKRFGFGAEVFVRPSYFADGPATLMLDLSYRLGYATCLLHGQPVADLYGDRYPGAAPPGAPMGPQDGCITAASHRLRTGLALSAVGGNGLFHLAGGFQYNFNEKGLFSYYPLTALPFYVFLGMGMPFG